MISRNDFLIAYTASLKAMYTWADHDELLEPFMESVVATINGTSDRWTFSGTAAANAWKTIGMEGPVTLEAIRAFPN